MSDTATLDPSDLPDPSDPSDPIPPAPAVPRVHGGEPITCRCGHMRDRLWLSPALPDAERAARRAQHTATLSSICPICRGNEKLKMEN